MYTRGKSSKGILDKHFGDATLEEPLYFRRIFQTILGKPLDDINLEDPPVYLTLLENNRLYVNFDLIS